jgi:hypothetical protein
LYEEIWTTLKSFGHLLDWGNTWMHVDYLVDLLDFVRAFGKSLGKEERHEEDMFYEGWEPAVEDDDDVSGLPDPTNALSAIDKIKEYVVEELEHGHNFGFASSCDSSFLQDAQNSPAMEKVKLLGEIKGWNENQVQNYFSETTGLLSLFGPLRDYVEAIGTLPKTDAIKLYEAIWDKIKELGHLLDWDNTWMHVDYLADLLDFVRAFGKFLGKEEKHEDDIFYEGWEPAVVEDGLED